MGFLSNQYLFKRLYKRLAVWIFDLLGSILFYIPNKCRKPVDLKSIQRVLFVRLDQIGDVVMSVPALRAAQEILPEATVDFLVSAETAPMFENDEQISRVIAFRNNWFSGAPILDQLTEVGQLHQTLKANKYDLVIDTRGDLRTLFWMFILRISNRWGYSMTGGRFLLTHCGEYFREKHQVYANLDLLQSFGAQMPKGPFSFNYSDRRKQIFEQGLGQRVGNLEQPRIVIHPASMRSEKEWSHGKYRKLIDNILRDNIGSIILIGTGKEKKSFGEVEENERLIDLRGLTYVEDLPILFDSVDLFIGNDSGPAHIAAFQGVHVVSIFKGPNDPAVWHPWTPNLSLMTEDENKELGVAAVLQEVKKVLENQNVESEKK